uniref:Uncharacterized protein n=1 Tax=Rhizophora mucronata TaxID=61149 RepID=A0A2P2QL07_RHIMU
MVCTIQRADIALASDNLLNWRYIRKTEIQAMHRHPKNRLQIKREWTESHQHQIFRFSV